MTDKELNYCVKSINSLLEQDFKKLILKFTSRLFIESLKISKMKKNLSGGQSLDISIVLFTPNNFSDLQNFFKQNLEK